MSNVYIDERLLDAAGLTDFPKLYAYIKEHNSKSHDQLPQPVQIGEQMLQEQMKSNDDVINGSGDFNEEFVSPVLNAIMKLDLSSLLERQSFLASSGSDSQLIVYGNRISLTASYAITGSFQSRYLFKNFPEGERPKTCDNVIVLVGSQIPSDTAPVNNPTYYKKYESQKINYDANRDRKEIIIDKWNVNKKGIFATQSHVYETVKKLTDLIDTGVQVSLGTWSRG
ncbi:MAG: hypothetical protein EZS28_007015 [Streblomastix strix]|uniref:Uncharacterized protein n=1 Tax=Streblomastix strix TaxID=222440 RepID=A0A5J4WSE7_9EUKA|nr:MAG: hypothetical protein EZS28_007015 [Streblomastix strix]